MVRILSRSPTTRRLAPLLALSVLLAPAPVSSQSAAARLPPDWASPGTVRLDGEAQRMANWSARVVAIRYGDMSRPTAWDSSVGLTLVLKNISTSAQNPVSKFQGRLQGVSTHGFDTFSVTEIGDVPPGGEVLVYANKRLSYRQHRGLTAVTVTESMLTEPGNPRSGTRPLATVSLPLPPLDPDWVDPNEVAVDGAEVRLTHWAARIRSVSWGEMGPTTAFSRDVIVTFSLRNLSSTPRSPKGRFAWNLEGSKIYNLGPFAPPHEEPVPPGGEITIVASRSLAPEDRDSLRSLILVEHQPGPSGALTARSELSSASLPLPQRPSR